MSAASTSNDAGRHCIGEVTSFISEVTSFTVAGRNCIGTVTSFIGIVWYCTVKVSICIDTVRNCIGTVTSCTVGVRNFIGTVSSYGLGLKESPHEIQEGFLVGDKGSNLDPPDYTSGCPESPEFSISLSISFLLFQDLICFSRASASALVENASENLSIQSPVLPVKPL